MSYSLHLIKAGDTVKAARAYDKYEFQLCLIGDDGSVAIQQEFTDDYSQAMSWAGQLKFDEEVSLWDWIVHYADGSWDFAFRSIWLEDPTPAA